MVQKTPSHTNHVPKGTLTTGSINRHLLTLSIPMMWGIFAIISFQLVDVYFISRLGTTPLAALGFTLPITMVVFSIFLGLTIAMSSVLSRQIGEGNHENVIRITTHGLIIAIGFGLFVAVSGIMLMGPVLRLMGANIEMAGMAKDYLGIWFAGGLFVTTPMIGNAALRATGDSIFPAIVMTTAALVNIILDPILIFGLWGFPRMELHGAALATVIANACAMGAGLYMLVIKKKMVSRVYFNCTKFTDTLKRLTVIALPAALTGSIQPVTNAVIIGFLASYGAENVAAYGVVTRVEAFAFIIIMGLAGGMAPIIGQNWGAGRFDRVNETLHRAFRFNAIWSIGVALFLGLFAKQTAGVFSTDEAVIKAASLYFWIVPVTYAAGNLVQGWSSAFNAMGLPKRATLMVFGKFIIIQIPLVMAGGHYFGVIGIFSAIALTNLGVGLTLHTKNWQLCMNWEQKSKQSF